MKPIRLSVHAEGYCEDNIRSRSGCAKHLFRETTVTTKHLDEGIAADFDSEGHLAGIEVLDALDRIGDSEVLRQVILEGIGDRVPLTSLERLFQKPGFS